MKTNLIPSLLLVSLISIFTVTITGVIGYNAGKGYGTSLAYNASYAVGYSEAFNNNKSDGYEVGYSAGVISGRLEGASQVSSNQINEARSEGFTSGRRAGYESGYSAGLADGNRSNQTARNEGIAEGRAIGFNEGYTKGMEAGKIDGMEAGIDGFLISKRADIRRELGRENYTCNTTNICEKTISTNAQTGRREWSVFNLNTMTHSINVDYTSDTGSQMKQRVVVDYKAGNLTAEWTARANNYSSPFVVYNFQSSRLIKNTTTLSDQERIEWLMRWYNGPANAKSISDNAEITWVLTANRN